MPEPKQRKAFCETHIRNKEGTPFSLKGRDWVIDEFWKPADAFKWWPVNPDRLCADCQEKAGQITHYRARNPTKTEAHRVDFNCDGLDINPIIFTVLNLPRREGKTFNTAAYCLSQVFMAPRQSISYIASAESQAADLFRENYAEPILQNAKLRKASKIVGNKILTKRTHSKIEFLRSSAGSITGRGRTHVVIDECRDVHPQVMTALIPSIRDQWGMECPAGHVQYNGKPKGKKKCPVCGKRLRPWYGRAILMSSSGILTGTEGDWFAELIEQLKEEPDPYTHMYTTTTATNPAIAEEATDAIQGLFGKLESTKHYIEAEIHNVSRKKGEDFLTRNEIEACIDRTLTNQAASANQCVSFLDTSIKNELTTWVILADDPPQSDEPYQAWTNTKIERIDIWDPKKMPGHCIDETAVQEHIKAIMPSFPGMRSLWIDVRGMPWAWKLFQHFKTQCRSWGKVAQPYRGNRQERLAGYRMLEHYVLNQAITLPPNPTLHKELAVARRHITAAGNEEIREISRKKRHLDVVESLAIACYYAHLESITTRQSLTRTMRDNSVAGKLLNSMFRPYAGTGRSSKDF